MKAIPAFPVPPFWQDACLLACSASHGPLRIHSMSAHWRQSMGQFQASIWLWMARNADANASPLPQKWLLHPGSGTSYTLQQADLKDFCTRLGRSQGLWLYCHGFLYVFLMSPTRRPLCKEVQGDELHSNSTSTKAEKAKQRCHHSRTK